MRDKTIKTSLILSSILMILTLITILVFMICDLLTVNILVTIKWVIIVLISIQLIGVISFMVWVFIAKDKKEKDDPKLEYLDLKFLVKSICEELFDKCPRCKKQNDKPEGETKK